MSRKAISLRGVEVDFDLQDIKNKIMTAPTPDVAVQRERFIDKRRRRGTRKKVDEMLVAQNVNESSVRAAIAEDRRKKQLEMERQPHVTLDETVIDAAEVTQNTPRRKIVRKDD